MIDAQAQRCIYAGAVQILASMNPANLSQQEAALDSAATLALQLWKLVEEFTQDESPKSEVFQPSDGKPKVRYVDPNDIQETGEPITMEEMIEGGFMPPPTTHDKIVKAAKEASDKNPGGFIDPLSFKKDGG